jgi:hypothetical protein
MNFDYLVYFLASLELPYFDYLVYFLAFLEFGKERGVPTHSWRTLEGEKGKKLIIFNFELLKVKRRLKSV